MSVVSISKLFLVNLSPKGLYDSILNCNNKLLDYNWNIVSHIVFSGLVLNRFGQAIVASKTECFSYLSNAYVYIEWFQRLKLVHPHLKVFWSFNDVHNQFYADNMDFWNSLNQVVIQSRADGIYVRMSSKNECYLKACIIPLIIEPFYCECSTLGFFQKYTSILVLNSFGFLDQVDINNFEKESDLQSTYDLLNSLVPFVDFRKAVLGLETSMLSYKHTNIGEEYTNIPIYLLSKLLFSGRSLGGKKYKFKRTVNNEIGSSTLEINAPPYFEMITYDSIPTRILKLDLILKYGFKGIVVGDISKDYSCFHTGSYFMLYENFLKSVPQ